MPFNIEAARKDGLSNTDIAEHLAQSAGFNIAAARKDGISDKEIAEHLASTARAPGAQASTEDRSALKQIPLGVIRGAATGLLPQIGAAQLQAENMSGLPAPKPEDYAAGVDKIVGGENAPKTRLEKVLSAAGAAVPWGLATGMPPTPASLGPAMAGGATSEIAGQAAEGTPFETPARIAGGLAGGAFGPSAVRATASGLVKAAQATKDAIAKTAPGAIQAIKDYAPTVALDLATSSLGVPNALATTAKIALKAARAGRQEGPEAAAAAAGTPGPTGVAGLGDRFGPQPWGPVAPEQPAFPTATLSKIADQAEAFQNKQTELAGMPLIRQLAAQSKAEQAAKAGMIKQAMPDINELAATRFNQFGPASQVSPQLALPPPTPGAPINAPAPAPQLALPPPTVRGAQPFPGQAPYDAGPINMARPPMPALPSPNNYAIPMGQGPQPLALPAPPRQSFEPVGQGPEKIIAATYTVGGRTFQGPNHVAAMDEAVKGLGLSGTDELVDLLGGLKGHRAADGFLTSSGRVVDRVEAAHIAEAGGVTPSRPGSLKMEDMTAAPSPVTVAKAISKVNGQVKVNGQNADGLDIPDFLKRTAPTNENVASPTQKPEMNIASRPAGDITAAPAPATAGPRPNNVATVHQELLARKAKAENGGQVVLSQDQLRSMPLLEHSAAGMAPADAASHIADMMTAMGKPFTASRENFTNFLAPVLTRKANLATRLSNATGIPQDQLTQHLWSLRSQEEVRAWRDQLQAFEPSKAKQIANLLTDKAIKGSGFYK